ncbi:LOW QUALITY PROTEIN: hypothetical protein OSB04_011750 [Centaurea solstitialis]|uniref:Uncharacterized protein n=1 Tax=Centaurea solstitialis TaxID=347529 RepID=A0AA38WQ99_9ASTR|nr:LOW QUALITY PROTEIN: hypothetical protein OSB04_011750 [Centaurea solstitialis]
MDRCMNKFGRVAYPRILVEVNADKDLPDEIRAKPKTQEELAEIVAKEIRLSESLKKKDLDVNDGFQKVNRRNRNQNKQKASQGKDIRRGGTNVPFVRVEYRPKPKNDGGRNIIEKDHEVKIGNMFEALNEKRAESSCSWEHLKSSVDLWFAIKRHPPENVRANWSEEQLEYYSTLCASKPFNGGNILTAGLGMGSQSIRLMILKLPTKYVLTKLSAIMIIKVDFEKTYDSHSWDYQQSRVVHKHEWNKFSVNRCLNEAIKLNGSPTDEFIVQRSLRHVDLLSPFLFIFAMEGLHMAVKWAWEANIFRRIRIGGGDVEVSYFCNTPISQTDK